jgi:hypothetical protein
MTGQRDAIEVLRDCLQIIEDIPKLVMNRQITDEQARACLDLAAEYMDAILKPSYRKLEKESKPLVASEPT